MAVKSWVILSTSWKLEDVQAGLVVFVSLLAFIAVFTSARFFWHTSASRIHRHADVPISSLLSFTTLGEVLDVIFLLKSKLFHSQHVRLAVQCLIVVAFSVCAILAGPISRYATKVGEKDMLRNNRGLLSTQSYSCELNNNIRWHNISLILDKAHFPHDRLLDFLPDVRSDWAFHETDWSNATYSAECAITTEANITLVVTGNHTNSSSRWMYDNVPGLMDVFSPRFRNDPLFVPDWSFSGTRDPKTNTWESVIFFSYAEIWPGGYTLDPTMHLAVHMSAIGMMGVPMYARPLGEFDYDFATGEIPNAWYTRAECDLTRNVPIETTTFFSANVDKDLHCSMAGNMVAYFYAESCQTHNDNTTTIGLPDGNDLFRFYQAYSVSKDTHFPWAVTRPLNIRVPTVELSVIFIVVASVLTLVVTLGMVYCLICRLTHHDIYRAVPETKVDWLLQSLREAEGDLPELDGSLPRHSVHSTGQDRVSKRKIAWEKARFSLSSTHRSPSLYEGSFNGSKPVSPSLGRISVHRGTSAASSSTSASAIPLATMSSPNGQPGAFSRFVAHSQGYNPLPDPTPYTGASPAPPYTSPPISPELNNNDNNYYNNDPVVSYGVTSATYQPMTAVSPHAARGDYQVDIVDHRW